MARECFTINESFLHRSFGLSYNNITVSARGRQYHPRDKPGFIKYKNLLVTDYPQVPKLEEISKTQCHNTWRSLQLLKIERSHVNIALAVTAIFLPRVSCRLVAEDACFRMRITPEVVLIRSPVCTKCVPGHIRSGSGMALNWRDHEKVVFYMGKMSRERVAVQESSSKY